MAMNIVKWSAWRRFRSQTPHELWSPLWDINRREEGDKGTRVGIHASSDKVIGLIGHNVTLPCRYDTKTNGLLAFCWGRGEVPRFKCSETILSSPGGAVLSLGEPSNLRYQLLGSMMDGEVSLTILNAQQSDAGVYGCRVEIPGWLNDIKVNIDLVMEEGRWLLQKVTPEHINTPAAENIYETV
eukprot:superscaffoldBa00001167_g9302